MGCDISERESGIVDAGRGAFLDALQSFYDADPKELTARTFVVKLREHARPQCRFTYSSAAIADELDRVARWFTSGGTYYDDDGDVRSVSGCIVKSSSRATRRHMMGEVNAKTSAEFTAAEKSEIDKLQPHNLLHNSAASQDSINGLALPINQPSDHALSKS